MPRDPSGNYTLPAGNPVVTGTVITSTWGNTTMSDIGAALTDSLSRSGNGGMLVSFKLADGTVSAPGLAWQSESNSGLYRAGAFDMRLTLGGADVFKWTSTGLTTFQNFVEGFEVTATAGNNGVKATSGTGVVSGLWGLAGSGSGFGVSASGVSGGVALLAASSATNVDVARVDGYISLANATNPAATTGFANRLTPKNICKAYCNAFINAGTVTIDDAFNIQAAGSWTLGGPFGDITIPFASAMANTNYTVVGIASLGNPGFLFYVQTKNTGSVDIRTFPIATPGTPLNPNTDQIRIQFVVYGAQ